MSNTSLKDTKKKDNKIPMVLCHKVIEKYKSILGLSDWSIQFSPEYDSTTEYLAYIASNSPNKIFNIVIGSRMRNADERDYNNVLLHELIHGKFGLVREKFEDLTNRIQYELEEEFVNEVTNAIEISEGKKRYMDGNGL